MYDDDRPGRRYGSKSRERDFDRDYDRGNRYRRSSRSPRRRDRHEVDNDYYQHSRKDDVEGRRSPAHRPSYRPSRPHCQDSSLSYDDEQTEYYRDHRPSPRSPPSRRYVPPPAQPSSTIVVEGLPHDATEDDIIDGFASVSPDTTVFDADNLKGVRLRNNRRGRRIGFVEFVSINAAVAFLDYHYPFISFQLAHSHGVNSESVSVRINYSWGSSDESTARDDRGREERGRDAEDWICPGCAYMNYGSRSRCHRCGVNKIDGRHRGSDESASHGPKLTGETDECPQQFPSQYVVIRGFEPSVTEEMFANGVKKLYIELKTEPKKETQNKLKSTAPTARTASLGARPNSLRRIFLVRDKTTNDAMRYGFAEFATLEDAQGAIEKFKASTKFAILSKPVTVAFIHTGVFVPHSGRVTDESSRYVFNPIYNQDVLLKYWDNRVYCSILNVAKGIEPGQQRNVENVEATASPEKPIEDATNMLDGTGKKHKKPKIGQGQSTAKPAIVMGPQMQMWAKKRAELVGHAQAQKELADENTGLMAAPADREGVLPRTRTKDTYLSYSDAETLSCFLCLRKFTSVQALRDHEVLKQEHMANLRDEEKREKAIERLKAQDNKPQMISLRVTKISRLPSEMVYTSYADRDNLHCLLCQRRFTKAAVLSLHERESEMHHLNLQDQSTIDRAISQLAKIGKTPRRMLPVKGRGTRYRDRAKERRQAYNQPNAPRRKALKEDSTPAREPEKQPAAPSKGAALLGKMGWTTGEGLGAERSGRTDVIATDMYAAGVGLGAEGGKIGDAAEEAARKTKDNPFDFIEVTRNKARERYEKLG